MCMYAGKLNPLLKYSPLVCFQYFAVTMMHDYFICVYFCIVEGIRSRKIPRNEIAASKNKSMGHYGQVLLNFPQASLCRLPYLLSVY